MDERWLISRRAVLGGIGLAGVSYFLPKGSPRALAQAAAPTRLLIVHVPEGMWRSASRPSASNTSTLGPIFGPLDPFRADITFVNGLSMKSRDKGPGGDGHHRGVPHMLTGIEMVDEGNAGGASIDQKIANVIGGGTKYKSLQFAVRIVYTDTNSRPIWSAPGRVVPALQNPWEAYTRIFGSGMTTSPTNMPSTSMPAPPKVDIRKSALDYALGEVTTLRGKLPAADRERLDSYQEALRDIERRLTTPTINIGDCQQPTLGSKIDHASEANYPMIGKLQMDLAVAALQCGVTRVATLQWGNSNDQCRYPWLGVNAIGHDLAHNNGNVDPSGSKKTTVFNWYSQQFAYLLGKLKNVKEGAGTMLDNTVVVWVSEFGESNGHSPDNLLWVVMGNAGGYFKQGQILEAKGRSTNDLHATLQNAFGIQDKIFGGQAYCSGAIEGLKA